MNEGLRLCSVALFGIGPVVALLGFLRRRLQPAAKSARVPGWRGRVPVFLLPLEWALPPLLIFFGVGEIEGVWPLLRLAGFVVALAGVTILAWAAAWLGRFLVHDAAILEGHVLVTGGPYRFVRHPVYIGYLALLLGSGVAAANVWVMTIWPISLLGILVQAGSEDQVLAVRFGEEHVRYVAVTGLLVPRCWGRGAER